MRRVFTSSQVLQVSPVQLHPLECWTSNQKYLHIGLNVVLKLVNTFNHFALYILQYFVSSLCLFQKYNFWLLFSTGLDISCIIHISIRVNNTNPLNLKSKLENKMLTLQFCRRMSRVD